LKPKIFTSYFLDELKRTNYLLVLEYADSGTLRDHLKSNFNTFKWEDQLKFAKEIASAILYLHDKGIVHRDLVSFIDFIDFIDFIIYYII